MPTRRVPMPYPSRRKGREKEARIAWAKKLYTNKLRFHLNKITNCNIIEKSTKFYEI